jgi:hypothetical protein
VSGAPFFAGTIEGVRAWSLSDDFELRGRGLGSSEAWAADGLTTEAACLHHDHPAPDPGCGCGLYALHPRARSSEWADSFLSIRSGAVAGVVEAWGRIELHEVGFRARFTRPKLLFEPAPHLISKRDLAAIHATAGRYRVPVVPLPRPEHAGEWCRVREIGLVPEVVEDTLLRDVRLTLRRTSQVSLDRRWLRVGVWPEALGAVARFIGHRHASRGHVDELPGIRIYTVRVRGPEAVAAFERKEFDPGRRLRLVRRATGDYEGVEVYSECGRIRLGALPSPVARELGARLAGGRVGEVRSLTRSVGLRDRVKGNGFLTVLVAPELPIEVEPEPDGLVALGGVDWTEYEPRVEP